MKSLLRNLCMVLAVAGLAMLQAGCPRRCEVKTARCLGNTVQICRPDGKWQDVVCCDKVDPKGPWNCTCTDTKTCRCKKPQSPPAAR